MELKYSRKVLCLFGPTLVERREKVGMSQSRLSIVGAINATQLRTIEKGASQPGVGTAIRLVAALDDDVGVFFQALATSAGLPCAMQDGIFSSSERHLQDAWTNIDIPSTKSIFGPAFKTIRLHYAVTQKTVAEKAQYNLRNLLAVEAGRQDPGIMTALAMVCAVGANVRDFFTLLHELQKSLSVK